jgi:hypothetical protein
MFGATSGEDAFAAGPLQQTRADDLSLIALPHGYNELVCRQRVNCGFRAGKMSVKME